MSVLRTWPAGTAWLIGLLVVAACGAWPNTRAAAARTRLARLWPGRIAPRQQFRPGPLGRAGRRDGFAAGALVASALDVLAACLYSGAPLERALHSVAGAFGDPVATVLGAAARQLALGAPPELAWTAALADPRWSPAARAIVRAHYSGAPLTDVLSRTADEQRRELRLAAEAGASRAAVRAVLPLGVCFLPAFVLVGIVPVVAGFAGSLWS